MKPGLILSTRITLHWLPLIKKGEDCKTQFYVSVVNHSTSLWVIRVQIRISDDWPLMVETGELRKSIVSVLSTVQRALIEQSINRSPFQNLDPSLSCPCRSPPISLFFYLPSPTFWVYVLFPGRYFSLDMMKT